MRTRRLIMNPWVFGVRDGRSYCGDGLSHLIDFEINGLGVGEDQGQGERCELPRGQKR